MDISYRDKKVRGLCEKQAVAERKLGTACARKLHARWSDLESARVVTDLAAGNPHPLKGDRDGQFAVELVGGMRLVFVPAHDPFPRRDDGGIDWAEVSSVRIVFIGDYHD
ncbi:MAG: hypothetical protein LBI92_00435 [Azoarcus sp.]|nr:hypothetical protein [Azoarcus sp.]